MASDSDPATEPFPIFRIAGRYLLFDPDVVRHARRKHNICGVLIGTIPNLSQQNIFLGIPLELTPEEARVLVEQGHAFVVDDVERHREGFMKMSREDRLKFLADMDKEGIEVSREGIQRAEQKTDRALKKQGLARKSKRTDESSSSTTTETSVDSSETLFDDPSSATPVAVTAPEKKLEPTFITPTTSDPPLSSPSPSEPAQSPPVVPKSYPLFRYLHSRGYFSMPGLRFGCHYSVYPGDPLRFHSHFLATGMDWDEEFELLDVIGGGRLGTGVKKAYLIGGEDKDASDGNGEKAEGGVVKAPVRAFSIEWAGL